MRFVHSAMSRWQRLGQSAGRLFVNVVTALVAGIAILLLVLSAHYQMPQSTSDVVTTTTSAP